MPSDTITTLLPPCQPPSPFLDPIPGVFPFGCLIVVSGASGAGKTIMFAEIMQRLRTGRTIWGHSTNPCTGYYVLAADRDWSTYAKAYAAAGFPEIDHYTLADDPGFEPRDWGKKHSAFALFEHCMSILNPIPGSIVYVDPAAPLFIHGNQNDARDVALSLHWFRKIARKFQITLVLFANVGKQRTEDTYKRAQDRIAGSGAFVAYSDTQVSIEQDEDGIVSVQVTPRNAPREEHAFKFDTATRLFVPDYGSPKSGEMTQHQRRIFDLVPEPPGSITSPELVKLANAQLDLKRAIVFRHISTLIDLKVIERSVLGVVTRKSSVSESAVDSRLPSSTTST